MRYHSLFTMWRLPSDHSSSDSSAAIPRPGSGEKDAYQHQPTRSDKNNFSLYQQHSTQFKKHTAGTLGSNYSKLSVWMTNLAIGLIMLDQEQIPDITKNMIKCPYVIICQIWTYPAKKSICHNLPSIIKY